MLDRLKDLLANMSGREDGSSATPSAFDADDPRVAAAALMYHVIQADGVLRDIEKQRFAEVLREEYSLEEADLQKLIEAAKSADDEAVDLYRFTSVLMRNLDRSQCIAFVEVLWEMVYADGYRHELEDNMIWRISDLLGVSARERVVMRQRVQDRLGMSDGSGDTEIG